MKMICNGSPVLGVEVGIDLVEEVKGRRVTCLDGKDQGKRTKTCHELVPDASITKSDDWDLTFLSS